MALLFGRDVKTIGKHISNALKEELAGELVVAESRTEEKDMMVKVVVNLCEYATWQK